MTIEYIHNNPKIEVPKKNIRFRYFNDYIFVMVNECTIKRIEKGTFPTDNIRNAFLRGELTPR